jgi:hypothetical protein
MKIYITNIFPSSIKDKLTNIQNLLITPHGTNKYEINSHDFGTHYIEKSNQRGNNGKKEKEGKEEGENITNIYRMEPNFDPKFQLIKGYNNGNSTNDLLIDYTKYTHCPVVSQLPTEYVLIKMIIFEYRTSPKSKLKLVVEYLKEPTITGSYFSTNKNTKDEMIPINFYFVYNNSDLKHENEIDLSDRFFQEEINMFLSHLN